MARISGTNSNDTLVGTNVNDSIFALGGNDFVNAGSGSDYVELGSGNDYVDGGGGSDTLWGGKGDDVLDSGYEYWGDTPTDNSLYGEAGNDTLYGSGGKDYLYGGTGNDFLYGFEGNDYLNAGIGQDTLLYGGSGSDTFDFDSAKDSTSLAPDIIRDFNGFQDGYGEGDIIDLASLGIKSVSSLSYNNGVLTADVQGGNDFEVVLEGSPPLDLSMDIML